MTTNDNSASGSFSTGPASGYISDQLFCFMVHIIKLVCMDYEVFGKSATTAIMYFLITYVVMEYAFF